MAKIDSIVIPVAGIGSRLLPLTRIVPKEMLRLVDRPIFHYLIEEAYLAGIRRVIFIIHSENRSLERFIGSRAADGIRADFPGISFSFVRTHERRGDGHAILQARRLLHPGGVFAVTMGDLVSMSGRSLIKELKEVYDKHAKPVISIERIKRSRSKQYGIIDPGKSSGRLHTVSSIVEKPEPKDAPSTLAMTGKYVLEYDIFSYIDRLIAQKRRGDAQEIKLADALSLYSKERSLQAYECKNRHYDTGNRLDLMKTEFEFALAHPEFGAGMRAIGRAYFNKRKR